MGAFTMANGVVQGFCLPDAFHNPHSWFFPRRDVFTARELHILRTRVVLDDPNKEKERQHISLAPFKKAFSNWRIWAHISITLGNNGPFRGFDTYGPTIIRSFGFPSLTSNALAAVGLFL